MRYIVYIIPALLLLLSCGREEKKNPKETVEEVTPQHIEFGFNFNDYSYVRDTVKKGDTFGTILNGLKVDGKILYQILDKAGDSVKVTRIKVGKPYVALCSKDSSKTLQKFIYQTDLINYFVVDLTDSIHVYNKKRPVTIKRRVVASDINSSLSQSINDLGVDYLLAHELSLIYAWSVDFFKIKKGDGFGAIINERYINDSIYAGVESIEASFFNYGGQRIYAFPFVQDSTKMVKSYYDENADALKSLFLKAPLKYSRISSRFSPKRFHPVQKKWKAHLGTDYAAPRGTPILATASGTVIKAGYNGGNGRYVKIKHNETYSTQYLHMSKILVKRGQYVRQGEVIGKVGSSGLATGPHVCYRFWKNGRQVDPLKQKIQKSTPLEAKYKERYFAYIKPIKQELDSIAKIKLKKNGT